MVKTVYIGPTAHLLYCKNSGRIFNPKEEIFNFSTLDPCFACKSFIYLHVLFCHKNQVKKKKSVVIV